MEEFSRFEKFLYIVIILLTVFLVGIQIGIHQGKELKMQEFYDYITTD